METVIIVIIYFIFNLAVIGVFLCADFLEPYTQLESELVKKLAQWLEKEKTIWGFSKKIFLISLILTALLKIIMTAARAPVLIIGLIALDSWLAVVTVTRAMNSAAGLSWNVWKKILVNALGIAITVSWIIFPNWLTIDLAGLFFAILILILVSKRMTLKPTIIISAAVIIYDTINVFGTEMMQGAASNFTKLPILLIVPSNFSLSGRPFFSLGLGDIVLPGLTVMLALKMAREYSAPNFSTFTLLGYIIGLLITLFAMSVTNSAQPATIYLIPSVFAGFFLAKLRHKYPA